MDLGPHALFIWLSYAAVVATLAVLMIRLYADNRRLRAELEKLEARGYSRRQ